MSLAEQIQRVDGGQNDTLKAILTALGVTVGTQKIDQLAALAATISPKLKPDNLNSAETNALYGLGADAVPDEVFYAIKEWIDSFSENSVHCIFGKRTGNGSSEGFSISFPQKPKLIILYTHGLLSKKDHTSQSFFCAIGEDETHVMGSYGDDYGYYLIPSVIEVAWNSNSITVKSSDWSDYDKNYPFNAPGRAYGYIIFM